MLVDASNALLAWYDANRRDLPWRAMPGESSDPYRVWLSEIMLQQTTVAAVGPYFHKFITYWPTMRALAEADEADVMKAWAGLGYYARARNLIACARTIVARHGGRFPDSEAELLQLPGVGRYTAAAVAAIAFGRRAVVVDGNVERVVARLFAVKEPLPGAKAKLYDLTDSITPARRNGDFAQAMMDLGATICTPRKPACGFCPLATLCAARAEGDPARYPVKTPKVAKPRRVGHAYWLERDGAVLLVRRPAKGLLGGMLAFPSSAWEEKVGAGSGAPAQAEWQDGGSIDHAFTHFALTLHLRCAEGEAGEGIWWPIAQLEEAGLPTVFAKLIARGRAWKKPPLLSRQEA
ncbi:A/G-specific adenine glycosylase [Allosphingosinicella flava]|uniref:Adenine DNA glycosylase n=1 Tax=Allosphingosinicella flava TaxID=2771430 RepID=A0A7T2GJB5_9SPHN|nr:A/G-specific adenine glycosylase [Sphingosinicella flava]QPQ54812.1 A/G-specific adenine glycosylase [Sphingosinicella flava]